MPFIIYFCIYMGHCISVYLMSKSELRDEKINSVLDNKEKSKEIKWTELPKGILATTHIPNIRDFGKDKTIAKISTDYFGGWGIQEAKLFVNNKKEYSKSSEQDMKLAPINDVLKMMGVVADVGKDEFDTINLSNYRSNQDFK